MDFFGTYMSAHRSSVGCSFPLLPSFNRFFIHLMFSLFCPVEPAVCLKRIIISRINVFLKNYYNIICIIIYIIIWIIIIGLYVRWKAISQPSELYLLREKRIFGLLFLYLEIFNNLYFIYNLFNIYILFIINY